MNTFFFRYLFFIGCILFGLTSSVSLAAEQTAPLPTPIKIVASFTVLADMVKNVCGDLGEVTALVGPDSDAHVYEPKPSDARLIQEARVVFINGLGFEGWMTRLIEAAQPQGPVVVATRGITPLPSSKTDITPDPHAWNSLGNALIYVANIEETLCACDPIHKDVYHANAARYKEQIRSLKVWADQQLASVPSERRHVVTIHDAFNYLGKDLGIIFHSPLGIDTKSEPSAKVIGQLIELIRTTHAAIFIENITNPHLLEQIAAEAKAPIGGKLYSDALSMDDIAPTFLQMARHNISQLAEAMKQAR